jgi:hypothetical protein
VSNSADSERPRIVIPQIFCHSCASPLVQATDWARADGSGWKVLLWCPECGFEQAAVLNQPQLSYLSLAIEAGFACLLEALAELDRLSPAGVALDLIKRARSERIERDGN